MTLKGLDVLLAEDNPTNQMVAMQMLESLGATVTLATDGEEALGLAQQRRFDVGLIDIEMPRLSGTEMIRQLRASGTQAAAMPLIALTAYVMHEHRAAIDEAGADGVIAKPILSIEQFGEDIVRMMRGAGRVEDGRNGAGSPGHAPVQTPVRETAGAALGAALPAQALAGGPGGDPLHCAVRRARRRTAAVGSVVGSAAIPSDAGEACPLPGPVAWADTARAEAVDVDTLHAAGPEPEPAVDLATLDELERAVGSEAMAELLGRVELDLVEARDTVRRGVREHDTKAVREATHVLMAVAGTIGALQLQSVSQALNASAHADDMPAMRAESERLLHAMAGTLMFIRGRIGR